MIESAVLEDVGVFFPHVHGAWGQQSVTCVGLKEHITCNNAERFCHYSDVNRGRSKITRMSDRSTCHVAVLIGIGLPP